ncbi:M4 family metallopeptidase [Stenotrophomonas pennii]|uniref:M4 family metallopeptidase n=1 Tax=Stenotrophomonas lacuserhaii TaxID=2760084 RepID=UPI003208E909
MTYLPSCSLLSLTVLSAAMLSVPAAAAERIPLHRLDRAATAALTNGSADASGLPSMLGLDAGSSLQLLSSRIDRNGVQHQRFEQLHQGIPVFGEHVVVATTTTGQVRSLFGTAVASLQAEVPDVAPRIDSARAAAIAKASAPGMRADGMQIQNQNQRLVIHLDAHAVARLAWVVDFLAEGEGQAPSRPFTIVDAMDGNVLQQWEGLATAKIGTGPGGNEKTGQIAYGASVPYLDVTVEGTSCTLENDNVKTINLNHGGSSSTSAAHSFSCPQNTVKAINGAYSPLNDAHAAGGAVFDMYRDWLDTAPLRFQLVLQVHYGTGVENAVWNGRNMWFGDGMFRFHPLVALDVVSHEVSHGFTEQNSGLIYNSLHSGGMNEAFSDIAGEAAEYYRKGSTDFLSGAEVFKGPGALRYFEDPTLDGKSIGHARDFRPGMDNHYSSGVYNRAFYLLSNREGWDPRKAFIAMATANQNYWTPSSTFESGACGVIAAALDLDYPIEDVVVAFDEVGVRCDA